MRHLKSADRQHTVIMVQAARFITLTV